ncbi:MAG: FecR domain-containing protein [Prevotella sp.]|nr:FecR domain-containing protein [Prevotella sp.]
MAQIEEQNLITWLICKQMIGEITEEEQQVLNAWRSENKYNEAAYQRLMDTDRQAMEYRRSKLTDYHRPLDDMKRRLGIGEETADKSQARSAFIYRIVSAAAVVLLIFGAAYYWIQSQVQPENTKQPTIAKVEIMPGRTQAVLTLDNGKQVELGSDVQMNTQAIAEVTNGEAVAFNDLTTPRGGEFKVTLEDGTEVWLNADSRLRYPETFEGNERRVEVTGEAYFKVAKNAEKPFYVVSGGQEVRVYGTEFNVHAYDDEATIFTTLVEGSISLRPVNGNKSELMLTPGKQALFNKDEAAATVRNVDTEVVTSWRSGVFVFEDQNLEQIMRTLSRWYDFEYEFADQQVAATVFMGSIPRYGSFAEVVEIFKKLGGINLHQRGRKVVISSTPKK